MKDSALIEKFNKIELKKGEQYQSALIHARRMPFPAFNENVRLREQYFIKLNIAFNHGGLTQDEWKGGKQIIELLMRGQGVNTAKECQAKFETVFGNFLQTVYQRQCNVLKSKLGNKIVTRDTIQQLKDHCFLIFVTHEVNKVSQQQRRQAGLGIFMTPYSDKEEQEAVEDRMGCSP